MFSPAGKDHGKPVRVLAMPQVSDEEFQQALKEWEEAQKEEHADN